MNEWQRGLRERFGKDFGRGVLRVWGEFDMLGGTRLIDGDRVSDLHQAAGTGALISLRTV